MDHRDGYIIAAKQYMDQVNKFIATVISLFNQIYHLSKKKMNCASFKFSAWCISKLNLTVEEIRKKSDHKPK